MGKAILGLFLYTYDYYEWKELICISTSRKLLNDKVKELNANSYLQQPLTALKNYERMQCEEKCHYAIRPVL